MAFSPQIIGTSGPDSLFFNNPDPLATALLMQGLGGDDTLVISSDLDGASVVGGQGNDSIYFDEFAGDQFSVLNSTITAGDGDDTVYVNDDANQNVTDWLNNFLNLNAGNDSLDIYAETITSSTFQGGQGDDTMFIYSELAQNLNLVNGNIGSDTIELDSDNLNFGDQTGFVEVTVRGGQGNDSIYMTNEVIEMSHFFGDLGDDTIVFEDDGDGNDFIESSVSGGDGADSVYFEGGRANIDSSFINLNSGNDTIRTEDVDVYSSTFLGGQGNDTMRFEADSFDIDFYDNVVNGNLGDDTIRFDGNGNDDPFINGTTIFGGQGNDSIDIDDAQTSGGSAATVAGNLGADYLIAADTFGADLEFFYEYGDTAINASGNGRDTIANFSGNDSISVAGGVGSLATLNTTSLNNFISDAAGSLNQGAAFQWYDSLVNSTYLFISDGSGDLTSDDILVQVLDNSDLFLDGGLVIT